jgi:hypothetical protein
MDKVKMQKRLNIVMRLKDMLRPKVLMLKLVVLNKMQVAL